MKISILLADDHKILREGLRSLIEKERELELIGEADNGKTAVQMACELKPDVVIMDVGMPDLNGIEATKQIMTCAPGCKVLAFSMHSDKRFVLEMLRAGARGYLLKESAFEELVNAVRSVVSNHMYLSSGITDIVVDDYVHLMTHGNESPESSLTHREQDVLKLYADGKNTKQIAAQLNISVKTIETHRRNIMNKLGISTMVELTKYAIRMGMTSLD